MTVQPGRLLSTGKTAEIYALGRDKVIKLYSLDGSEYYAAYESDVTDGIIASGGPAAQNFGTVQVDNKHGLVLERIPGKTILRTLTRAPWKAGKSGRTLAQLHARVHWTHVADLRKQSLYLPAKIALSSALLGQRYELILNYLDALPVQNYLCHGDFHPQNAIASPRRAVALDWIDAYSGSACGDVANTYLKLQSPYARKRLPAAFSWLARIVQQRFCSAYISEYTRITGYAWQDIEPWILPIAAAQLEAKTADEQQWLLDLIDEKLESLESLKVGRLESLKVGDQY